MLTPPPFQKLITFSLLAILLSIILPQLAFPTDDDSYPYDPELLYVPGQLLIQFTKPVMATYGIDGYAQTGIKAIDSLNKKYGVKDIKLVLEDDDAGPVPKGLENIYQFYFSDLTWDMDKLAKEYMDAGGEFVVLAEPNFVRMGIDNGTSNLWPPKGEDNTPAKEINQQKGQLFPTDMWFPSQWYLNSTGYPDINAPEAWYEIKTWLDTLPQVADCKVGVLGSLIWSHYDFSWGTPPLLLSGWDFVDDDDCIFIISHDEYEFYSTPLIGYFSAKSNNASDEYSFIASTNWTGLSDPPGWEKNSLPLHVYYARVLDEQPYLTYSNYPLSDVATCLDGYKYLIANSCDIDYIPLGGYGPSKLEYKAILIMVNDQNALVVAPAGYVPTYAQPIEPILFPSALPEVFSVGSLNKSDEVVYTNEFANPVFYAPGVEMMSLFEVAYVSHIFFGPSTSSALVVGCAASYINRYNCTGADARYGLEHYFSYTPAGYHKLNYYKLIARQYKESLQSEEVNKKLPTTY